MFLEFNTFFLISLREKEIAFLLLLSIYKPAYTLSQCTVYSPKQPITVSLIHPNLDRLKIVSGGKNILLTQWFKSDLAPRL